ncbi:MAG: trypsin-like peptidase domain-containing protein [Planctomycetota bacterium]|jgi:S1-C subfamily serine protease
MRKLSGYGPALVVLGTALVILFAGPGIIRGLTYAHTKARIIQASEGLASGTVLQDLNQAYRDIADLVEPSVVHISVEGVKRHSFGTGRPFTSSGSGWIYDEQGHIVTNYHVVEDATRIEVQLYTGELREAELVGYDPFTDIALLRIPAGRLFAAPRAEIEEDEIVHQGDLVFAFGSPFDFRFSMSSGVVSGIGRSVGVIRDDRGRWMGYENFIQVDAAINPGNSGGPLTDTRGRVIGMNTAIATGGDSRGFEGGQFAGIGLAIPIDMIEPVANQLIATGTIEKGFLGIGVVERSRTLAGELQGLQFPIGRAGVMVAHLDPGQPAARDGLRIDDVILSVDGESVPTVADFRTHFGSGLEGRPITVTVWRYDETRDRPELVTMELAASSAELPGLAVLQFNDRVSDLLEQRGFAGRGVRIIRVEPDGPAAEAGLRRGDVITEVNGRRVTSMRQLQSVISSMLPGQTARVSAWRYYSQLDEGRMMDVDVPLARLPLEKITGALPGNRNREKIDSLGIADMTTATEGLANRYGVAFHRGVIIEAAVPGSQLDGRVEPGAIIVDVMGHPVTDVDELFERLKQYDLRGGPGGGGGVRIGFIMADGQLYYQMLHAE